MWPQHKGIRPLSRHIKLTSPFPSLIRPPRSHCNLDNDPIHKSSFPCLFDSRDSARRQKGPPAASPSWPPSLPVHPSNQGQLQMAPSVPPEGQSVCGIMHGEQENKKCQLSHWLSICVWHTDHDLLCSWLCTFKKPHGSTSVCFDLSKRGWP